MPNASKNNFFENFLSLASLNTIDAIINGGFELVADDRHRKDKKSLWKEKGVYGGVLWRAGMYCNNPNLAFPFPGDKVKENYIVYVVAVLAAQAGGKSVKISTGEVFIAHQPHVCGLVVWVLKDHEWEIPELEDPTMEELRKSKHCELRVLPEVVKKR